jgi:hypothetical protein
LSQKPDNQRHLGIDIAALLNMIKTTGLEEKLLTLIKKVGISEILPFRERPSDEKKDKEEKKIEAIDLFSMFTADIIKEEVVFTR